MAGFDPAVRQLEREWLDDLPAEDPAAQRSRRDLRRVNRWMGHVRLGAELSREALQDEAAPWRMADVGAGDAFLTGQVLEAMKAPGGILELVDPVAVPDEGVLVRLRAAGWDVRHQATDVLGWCNGLAEEVSLVFINLFLHHLDDEALKSVFACLQKKARAVVALEPRREWRAWAGVVALPLIGCGRVTRHDARLSVASGFRGEELSRLWREAGEGGERTDVEWRLEEGARSWFSHCFSARRRRA